MYGICAQTRDPAGVAVRAMNAKIARRGPDGEGLYVERKFGIAVGARPELRRTLAGPRNDAHLGGEEHAGVLWPLFALGCWHETTMVSR